MVCSEGLSIRRPVSLPKESTEVDGSSPWISRSMGTNDRSVVSSSGYEPIMAREENSVLDSIVLKTSISFSSSRSRRSEEKSLREELSRRTSAKRSIRETSVDTSKGSSRSNRTDSEDV